MNIVIAPDSFKGSMSATEICDIGEKVAKRFFPDIDITKVPLADGGEGTVESVINATKGEFFDIEVQNPLQRSTIARYGIMGDGKTAVIEMAEAAGLHKIDLSEQNPMVTSTYGVGQIILHALDRGCQKFIIGIGGSATNDCGIGLIQALGAKVKDQHGNEVNSGGRGLLEAAEIDLQSFDQRVYQSEFVIACDVTNPLFGERGAAYIFAPQKGATPEMVRDLDRGLRQYSELVLKTTGIETAEFPGAGAAGGLGACFMAFFRGKLQSGIDIIIEATKLPAIIQTADIVITGEGKIDNQTRFGKAPYGVAKLAYAYEKPVIAICGILEVTPEGLREMHMKAAFSVIQRPCSLEQAMAQTSESVELFFYNLFNTLQCK